MKKIVFTLFIMNLLILPVYAEEYITEDSSFTYNQAVTNIQETMKAYYMRGPSLQYNYARAGYGDFGPEDATSQHVNHLVCASYTYSTYVEAFGMNGVSYGFPRYNYEITEQAKNYYEAGQNLDGHFLRYYATKNNATEYIYSGSNLVKNFAETVQPGDLFTYTGHAMIAYQVVERTTSGGVKYKDVLMLNSETGGAKVRTRDSGYSTSDIFYNFLASPNGNNNIIDIDAEGTVRYFWLSEEKHLTNAASETDPTKRILKCSEAECTSIRIYTKTGTNGVTFNFPMLKSRYNRSKLRTEYPGLYIEKTVDKIDNNSVYLRDTLVYTIEVTNKSKLGTAAGQTYNNFAIAESIDKSLVKYVNSSSGTYDDNTGKITFKINQNLAVNQKITLTYTVEVLDNDSNIDKNIISNGAFYKLNNNEIDDSASIPTGKVENKIIEPIQVKPQSKTYSECYNANKNSGKIGLDLIDDVYDCYYGDKKPVDFDNFDIATLIWKRETPLTSKSTANVVKINPTLDSTYQKYKSMILNNYYGGMMRIGTDNDNDGVAEADENGKYNYIISNFGSSDTRAKYIDYHHFQDGDILVYYIDYSQTKSGDLPITGTDHTFTYPKYRHTAEAGTYAYIYINGEFVGINGTANRKRNAFTYDYYCTSDHENNTDYKCDTTCMKSSEIYSCTEDSTTWNQLYYLSAHLYSNIINVIGSSDSDTLAKRAEVLKIANYQTLYDKDYYVILRPSKLVPGNTTITFSNNYSVVSNKNALKISLPTNLQNGMTYANLLNDVDTDGLVSVKNTNSEYLLSGDYLKTGYIFNGSFSEKKVYPGKTIEYKIIIKGDVLSEGKISTNGTKATARHVLDGNVITNEDNLMAADMDDNGEIKMNDVMRMLNKDYIQ